MTDEITVQLSQDWITKDQDDGDGRRLRWLIRHATRSLNRNTIMIQMTLSSPNVIGDIPSEVRPLLDKAINDRTAESQRAEVIMQLSALKPDGQFTVEQVADLIIANKREALSAATDRANGAEVKLLAERAKNGSLERKVRTLQEELNRRGTVIPQIQPWE